VLAVSGNRKGYLKEYADRKRLEHTDDYYANLPDNYLKKCGICKLTLHYSFFYKRRPCPDGFSFYCKKCNRIKSRQWKKNRSIATIQKETNRRFLNNYGISLQEVERMIIAQDNRCAICKQKAKLHIDHDHESGLFRGLLCPACNKALGLLRDNVQNLKAAIIYLEHIPYDAQPSDNSMPRFSGSLYNAGSRGQATPPATDHLPASKP
jgi:hypothetical protein